MDIKKSFKAFTLVEMLIVMGIIVILMAVGIASGRFAIQRANKIEHQNAADQIYQGLQGYYTDNREFPDSSAIDDVQALVTNGGVLGIADYIDEFDGGSEATFYYLSDTTQQEVIVCVSLGGIDDTNELGFYCTGNGLGSLSTNILVKDIPHGSGAYDDVYTELTGGTYLSTDWEAGSNWGDGVDDPVGGVSPVGF